jgi:hypothetical protein
MTAVLLSWLASLEIARSIRYRPRSEHSANPVQHRVAIGSALLWLANAHATGASPNLAIEHWTLVTTDLSDDGCSRATSPSLTVEADSIVQYCFGVRNIGTVPTIARDVVTDTYGQLFGVRGSRCSRARRRIAISSRSCRRAARHRLRGSRDATPPYTPSLIDFSEHWRAAVFQWALRGPNELGCSRPID